MPPTLLHTAVTTRWLGYFCARTFTAFTQLFWITRFAALLVLLVSVWFTRFGCVLFTFPVGCSPHLRCSYAFVGPLLRLFAFRAGHWLPGCRGHTLRCDLHVWLLGCSGYRAYLCGYICTRHTILPHVLDAPRAVTVWIVPHAFTAGYRLGYAHYVTHYTRYHTVTVVRLRWITWFTAVRYSSGLRWLRSAPSCAFALPRTT